MSLHATATELREIGHLLDALDRAGFTQDDLTALCESGIAAKDALKAVQTWASGRVLKALEKLPYYMEILEPDVILIILNARTTQKQMTVPGHVHTQRAKGKIVGVRLHETTNLELPKYNLVIRINKVDDECFHGDWYWDLWDRNGRYISGGTTKNLFEMAQAISKYVK